MDRFQRGVSEKPLAYQPMSLPWKTIDQRRSGGTTTLFEHSAYRAYEHPSSTGSSGVGRAAHEIDGLKGRVLRASIPNLYRDPSAVGNDAPLRLADITHAGTLSEVFPRPHRGVTFGSKGFMKES